ncbi:MAG: hypothetical protein ABFE08_03680 [Armatimonadia bacterium]
MDSELRCCLGSWCHFSLDAGDLDEMNVWQAMHWREELRAAIAEGLELRPDEQIMLEAADRLFAAAREEVVPLLKHRGWLERQPPEHYAHAYAGE